MAIKSIIGYAFFIIGVLSVAYPQTLLTVKQDGTGDFTEIQAAVDSASNGDTVLVYPGRYFENVILDHKNIVLGSLTLTTGNQQFIKQTIVDGNKIGRCIKIFQCESSVEICGFTITNGKASGGGNDQGGGVRIFYSIAKVIHCVVDSNLATAYGGGIGCQDSEVFLSGVTIKDNHSYYRGGGLMSLMDTIVFDTVHRCNIYMNYAARGTDICKNGDKSLHVVLDTFTVANPDYYYINSVYGSVILDDITHNINVGILPTVSHDLYVANNGDNSNSGIGPDEPVAELDRVRCREANSLYQLDACNVM